jgi:hypothetical protein
MSLRSYTRRKGKLKADIPETNINLQAGEVRAMGPNQTGVRILP